MNADASTSLGGKTIFMSGGSRGVGLAIARRAAQDGANVALVAKTDEPHPQLSGTIHTAAEEIRDAGGQALPIVGDIREADAVDDANYIRVETSHVVGVDVTRGGSGDPSPLTALGVLQGMRACAEEVFGATSLKGKLVAVQGVGHVGYHLCRLLHENGASIMVTDVHEAAVERAVEEFGAIDIVINNASAINLSGTEELEVKRYDLMQEINVRGTFVVTKACLPHLKRADNPHVLTLSPPLNLDPRWFGAHVAYTISKYSMSMLTLGWAEEFREDGIAFNSLWPRTMIATAAVMNLLGGEEAMAQSRTPEILADAAHAILVRPSRECSGNFFIDEDVLAEEGITELDHYRADPQGGELTVDLFLD